MLSDPSSLRARAGANLTQVHNPGRVVLIHTGAMLSLSLLLSVADFLLNQQIGTTGGLSGMGQRSVLTTIQSLLRLAQLVILPFWQIGYTYYTLKAARGQAAGVSDLTEGFRRFGPVLRLKALMLVMGVLLGFVCTQVSSFLFMMTPWAAPMMAKMETLMADGSLTEEALITAILAMREDFMVPILILFGICFLAGFVFLFFRFRLAELWLMDHPEDGALAALRSSTILMQGNCKAMFKIDLHFWWFYLLELLVAALGYGDAILRTVGIQLTADAFGTYIIFFALYIWAQMSLYWWKRNEVCLTYAHAYLELCPDPVETKDKEKDPVL